MTKGFFVISKKLLGNLLLPKLIFSADIIAKALERSWFNEERNRFL